MNRVLFGLGLGAASIALAAGVQERAIAADYRVSVAASLIGQKSDVPILLPSEDVVERNKFNPDETLYAYVQTASESYDYQVEFNNQPGSVGRVAFRFSIKAKRGANVEQSSSDRGSTFQNFKLIDGSKAVVMTQCGAGCWSRVQWRSSGILYEVWSKTRTPETALAIANSAVKAGDRSKASVNTADNRSAQSIANLPDGQYFYGQSPEVNQVGKMYYLFKKRGDQATGLVFAPRAGDSPCFTGTIQGNQIKRVTLAFASYDRSGKNANWSSSQVADYNLNGTYRLDINQYRGDVKDEISRCQSGISQVVAPSQPSSTSSPQANGQKGAVNLGGSSYFSWGLLKPESRDNTQAQIVMGYGCQTQNQLEGISQRASMSRYVIKRGRGSDDWWLESLGGVVVRPTPNGYVSEKVEGISSSKLKRYITDSSSGFLKRDMDVDGLGNACINGGIQGALNYIQGPVNNKPIAQPAQPLTPIAASNTYAYPSPQEFAQFKKTLRPSPIALSAADRKLRQDFQAEWQKKNPAIGPYVGAWKTADNQDVYVFPSTQAGRACVVEKSDGEFKAVIGVSMKADMRYALTHGLFRVTGVADVVAGRSDKSQPLSALYGAIGSPEVSDSVKEELEQAKCVGELPKVVASTKSSLSRKPYPGTRMRDGAR
jgi:hypothetical protein